jgi:hypothetical protein
MRSVALVGLGVVAVTAAVALAQAEPPPPQRAIPNPVSGREFATPETLAIQDDDFLNPAFLLGRGGRAGLEQRRRYSGQVLRLLPQ